MYFAERNSRIPEAVCWTPSMLAALLCFRRHPSKLKFDARPRTSAGVRRCAMSHPRAAILMEEKIDPEELAGARAQRQRFNRNPARLQTHAAEDYGEREVTDA